jgi:hypothetical protein
VEALRNGDVQPQAIETQQLDLNLVSGARA